MSRVNGIAITIVIARRELTHFVRQPSRVMAAVGTPVLLWAFMASGFSRSLEAMLPEGSSYGTFLLPGAVTLVTMFASIFAAISVIEERQQGWLRSVIVSPAPRWSIAAGKILGGSLVSCVQAVAMLLALLWLPSNVTIEGVAIMLVAVIITAIAMSAMGLVFAWRSQTSAGFHAVMNLVFLPMWMLSGAFFPIDGASSWLASLTTINPLTLCTEAIRTPLNGQPWPTPLLLATGFAVIMTGLAIWTVARDTQRSA